jgi:hypothetical protein
MRAAMDLVVPGTAVIVEAEFGFGLAQQQTAVGAGRVRAACPPQDLRAGKSKSTMGLLRRAGTTHHVASRVIGTHISHAVLPTKDDFAGLLLTCSHTKSEQERKSPSTKLGR